MTVAVQDVSFPITGVGNVKLRFGQRLFTLKNVMFSENLRRNLVSGPQLDLEGVEFKGKNGKVKFSRLGSYMFSAHLKKGVYQFFPSIPKPAGRRVTFEANITDTNTGVWHKRFGHISPTLLVHTSRNDGVRGLPNIKDEEYFCEPCKINKFKRPSLKSLDQIRSTRPLQLLFADVWGPCKVVGRHGEKYFLSIIDDFSRRVSIYPIKMKSDVYDILKGHIIKAENFLDLRVKAVRTDNGGEFVNDALDDFFDSKGIHHELTNAYTPQQNGACERFMQTIANGARTLLFESKLPSDLWPEAMKYFCYTWNRVCPKALTKTPFELYGGTKPSVRHLKPFGAVAYVGIPSQTRTKLDPKARKGYMVGYAFSTKGYRIWLPESNKIVESIHVSFNEVFDYDDSMHSGVMMGPEEFALFPSKFGEDPRGSEVDSGRVPSPLPVPRDSQTDEGEDDESGSEDSASSIPLKKEVRWERKAVPRSSGRRTDIYYYEEGQNTRLRGRYEVERYCNDRNILYNPDLFDFSGSNNYSGVIPIPDSSDDDDDVPSTSSIESSL